MAALVLKDPFISLAANDLSAHFMAVTINPTADTQESTAFGDDWGLRRRIEAIRSVLRLQPGLRRRCARCDGLAAVRNKGGFRGSAQIGGPSSCKSQLDRDVHHQRIPADWRQHWGSDHRNSDRPRRRGASEADCIMLNFKGVPERATDIRVESRVGELARISMSILCGDARANEIHELVINDNFKIVPRKEPE